MRTPLFFAALLTLLLSASAAFALTPEFIEHEDRFLAGTAHTLSPGQLEVGVFAPLRVGITDRLELQGHPLAFFVAPNARLRAQLFDDGDVALATTLGVTYPSFLLNLLAAEGAGGILPPDRAVPQLVSLFGEVAATRRLSDHYLTAAMGVQVAPRFGEDELVTVDVPFAFPRMAAFFTTATAIFRVQAQGPIFGPLGYHADLRVFAFPGVDGAFAVEPALRLRWRLSQRWLLQGGAMYSYGGYPFGVEGRFLPVVDLLWAR